MSGRPTPDEAASESGPDAAEQDRVPYGESPWPELPPRRPRPEAPPPAGSGDSDGEGDGERKYPPAAAAETAAKSRRAGSRKRRREPAAPRPLAVEAPPELKPEPRTGPLAESKAEPVPTRQPEPESQPGREPEADAEPVVVTASDPSGLQAPSTAARAPRRSAAEPVDEDRRPGTVEVRRVVEPVAGVEPEEAVSAAEPSGAGKPVGRVEPVATSEAVQPAGGQGEKTDVGGAADEAGAADSRDADGEGEKADEGSPSENDPQAEPVPVTEPTPTAQPVPVTEPTPTAQPDRVAEPALTAQPDRVAGADPLPRRGARTATVSRPPVSRLAGLRPVVGRATGRLVGGVAHDARWGRRVLIAVAVVLAAAVPAWAAARIASPGHDAAAPAGTPSPARPAALSLRDGGASVRLSWRMAGDPPTQFAVLVGATGSAPVLWRMTPGGAATATVDDLDATRNYCFQVVAVYPHTVVRSPQVCTVRSTG